MFQHQEESENLQDHTRPSMRGGVILLERFLGDFGFQCPIFTDGKPRQRGHGLPKITQ